MPVIVDIFDVRQFGKEESLLLFPILSIIVSDYMQKFKENSEQHREVLIFGEIPMDAILGFVR